MYAENNRNIGPSSLDVQVSGEDGMVFFTIRNDDGDGETIMEFTVDTIAAVEEFIEDAQRAVQEAF